MKNLNRSARSLNTILGILFWIVAARGVFTAGYHCVVLFKLFSDPVPLTMGLTVDFLTLEAASGFPISFDAAISMKLLQLVSAVVITVIACLGLHCLKGILLPIELGQPFRKGISGKIRKLGVLCFWMGLAENLTMLLAVLLIENNYCLTEVLINETVTGVSLNPKLRPAWFLVTAVLSILTLVFRHGEQLQQLSDETL